ncbi:MAG: thioredoxin domain-containing protein [Acidobacteriota bacterium]
MENNNKSSLPVAIIGIVALVAIGLGAWFYLGSKKDPGTAANTTPKSEKNWGEVFSKAPPGASPAWAKGSSAALVTIEEFADFQCPTCAVMHPKVNEVRNAFGDRVRIVFRQFPLTQTHPYAYDAACATEAAGMQGKFWEMQNLIFTNQQSWANSTNGRAVFAEYAKTLGLNIEQFSNDVIGLPVKNRVDADMQRGRAIGVGSTPSFYINNKPLGNNLDGLRAMVEKVLQEAEGAKQTPPSSANSSNANSNK